VAAGRRYGWRMPDLRPAAVAAPRAEPVPQDAVYAMLDAARRGDVKGYLACYAGQMSASLARSVAETGEARFAAYLKESNAAIKGVALAEPGALNDREVKLRVEYIYQDRNEAQWMYLEKTPAGWKIARVDGAERVKTLVPYGTPVE
jgi:hypothetical protein